MANNPTCSSAPSFRAANAPGLLSDRDLLDTTARVASDERRTTAEVLALLAELDTRKLYLGEGYASLFTYCTQRLHLSESAAFSRINAARVARRFPIVFVRLAEGDVTLTSVSLLAAHLTDDNHESLLDAARHATRRDVERLVAGLHQQPDIPAGVRRLPTSAGRAEGGTLVAAGAKARQVALLSASRAPDAKAESAAPPSPAPTRTAPRPVVAPLAVDRYLLRLTIDAPTHAKLERARDLLRHTIPNGDPARIIDRALTVLVEQLEKRKAGRVSRPEDVKSDRSTTRRTRPIATGPGAKRPLGRHVPAAVKREVWSRDEGRCAFIGPHGRCSETGFLEYHHVVPFAAGGATDVTNLELRCRAHNTHEATVWFGEEGRGGARSAVG